MRCILNNVMSRTKSLAIVVAAAWAAVSQISFAAPYAKGDRMESFQVKTQHDQEFTFRPNEARVLLVTHDMDTGKKANAVLTTFGKEKLAQSRVLYLANIHGMPGIGRMFALPKMRRYSHIILLGDSPELIARFPEEKGKVTVLHLSDGRIDSVRYWSPGEQPLDEFLK
jgi:hypothetical protein